MIGRLKFGGLSIELTSLHRYSAFHMEVDTREANSIIFSSGYQVLRYNTLEDRITVIAGNASVTGYKDGKGDEALFDFITGFTQMNSSTLVVADKYNHCLRLIELLTGRVSHYAGTCKTSGFVDGTADSAQFYYPQSIITSNNKDLIVADSYNYALRKVSSLNGNVTTLITNLPYTPRAITRHPSNSTMIYVSCECVVITVNLASLGSGYETLTTVPNCNVRRSYPSEILFLSDHALMLSAGAGDFFIYNIDTDRHYSIDSYVSRSRGLLLVHNQIFIGTLGGIKTLPGERVSMLAKPRCLGVVTFYCDIF